MNKPGQPTVLNEAALAARLRRVLIFLRRKWWIPALLVVAAGAGQTAWLMLRPASYTAVGRMWVGGKVRLPENSYFSEEWQNFFGTQIELMQSQKIRQRALKKLRAGNTETNFQPIKVEVSQPRKTAIFNLTAQGTAPDFLQAYLNAVMEEYLDYKREVRASSSDDTVASLSEQLEKVERELKTEQEKLTDFQRSNNIVVLREGSVSTGNQLNKLNLQLSDFKLEADLLALVSPEEQLEKQGATALNDTRRPIDAALSAATPAKDYFLSRQQRDLKMLERKELGEYLRPEHPTIVKLSEEITHLNALLNIYIEQSREQLNTTRETLALKIKAVQEAIQTLEPRVVNSNERLAQYERSKMNLERVQAMHTRLVQAINNVDVNKSVDQESVSIMDRAQVLPTPRRLAFKVALASVVALIVGLGIVLFVESKDQRLFTTTELQLGVSARLLGCVPDLNSQGSGGALQLLTRDDSRHTFVESFRNLRASVHSLRRDGRAVQTILITSAVPAEGKSTIAANLAYVLAFAGARVLLIDGDVRRGRLHEILGLQAEPGLTELIQSTRPAEEFFQVALTPNVSFLSRGAASDQCGELFTQKRFSELLENARAHFDYVLIDSSPVLAAADSCALAPSMDAILFVIRARFTALPLARQAIELQQEHNAPLLATVFNRVDKSSGDYAFHRYNGYGNFNGKMPSRARTSNGSN